MYVLWVLGSCIHEVWTLITRIAFGVSGRTRQLNGRKVVPGDDSGQREDSRLSFHSLTSRRLQGTCQVETEKMD
jgi:hypothetical protein